MGTHIHWLAVIVAGVGAFMVGGVWYSALFGKVWMAARGVSPESMTESRSIAKNLRLKFGFRGTVRPTLLARATLPADG